MKNKELYSKENKKIERMQSEINYSNDKIYIRTNSFDYIHNPCFISKRRINNKIKLEYNKIRFNNEIEFNEIEKDLITKQISNSICYINKTRKYNYIKFIDEIQYKYKSHFNKNKLNYLALLINLFVTKNVQEYIFKILKAKKDEIISINKYYYPFYIKTIKRIINYIEKAENPNPKITLFFEEVFKYSKNKKQLLLKLICFLLEKNKNKLNNSNIFTGYEEKELIQFLTSFSEFDKNLNNETFIIERLKRTQLNNTNIFTLVKLIDNEYNNLVKGLYCTKCFYENNLCHCNKEKDIKERKNSFSVDISKSHDKSLDNLNFDDIDLTSEDAENKRQINYFDYKKDDKDDNNILIKTKTTNNNNQKLLEKILPENESIKEDN